MKEKASSICKNSAIVLGILIFTGSFFIAYHFSTVVTPGTVTELFKWSAERHTDKAAFAILLVSTWCIGFILSLLIYSIGEIISLLSGIYQYQQQSQYLQAELLKETKEKINKEETIK